MATATPTRFRAPKQTLFPVYMNKARTSFYPSDPPRLNNKQHLADAAQIRSLAWSPLGTQIATTTSIVKSIKLWDPEKTKAPVMEFLFRGEKAEKVLYHPLGEPEVVCVGEDGLVRFFDTRVRGVSGEVKAGLSCFTLAWSPDGTELVVGKKNDDLVRIDRASRSILSTTRMKDTTNQTTFNWTGDTLLTTTADGAFLLFDYPSFTELARFPAHNSSCNCIAYHPAGAYVATGANDGLISLYRTDGWLPAQTFDAQTGSIKTVSFSCDGTYVAGGSDEGQGFEIGNVETGESAFKVEAKAAVPVVAWSPKDYAIAYIGDRGACTVVGAPVPT